MTMNFDPIRSYTREEVPAALERLSQEKQFINLLSTVYPLIPKDILRTKLLSFTEVNDFQKEMVYPFLQYLEATLTKGISLEGQDKVSKDKAYLYISNHRDIVLDSALFCGKLIENDFDTVEIAIGDNLLALPWIEDMVRMNKSFIVRRSPGAKQMLEASTLLSTYIADTINNRNQSAWIAQREGRAKDSNDRTQESLLKMLNMGGSGSFASNLAALHICPLSISYEYDPCDFLKAREFQQKRDIPNFTKAAEDDLISMRTGVMGYKGKVVYRIAGDISEDILLLGKNIVNRNELVASVAAMIDRHIYSNYEIYNVNRIAFDLLEGRTDFEDSYTLIEKLDFQKYLTQQIEKIDLENKDYDFLMMKLLEMYANPLKNAMSMN